MTRWKSRGTESTGSFLTDQHFPSASRQHRKGKDCELLAICNQTKYYEEPVAYGSLTKEQFDAEIEKGMEDIKAGRVYSADEVEAEMKREFGL